MQKAKYIFLMPPLLIVTATMAAALPSGSQTYYFSYRYNSLQNWGYKLNPKCCCVPTVILNKVVKRDLDQG